jgi:hypothetical protein
MTPMNLTVPTLFSEPTADLPHYWVTHLITSSTQSLQDTRMSTNMWSQVSHHGSMAFIVIQGYRKFVAKNNKWAGHCTQSKSCNILQWTTVKPLLTKN